jgi:hypothetical protein
MVQAHLDPAIDNGVTPSVRATCYTVSCFPASPEADSSCDLLVEERSPGRWAIRYGSECLKRNGKLVYEPLPSARSAAFLAATRFDLDEALAIARKYAPKIAANGRISAQARR